MTRPHSWLAVTKAPPGWAQPLTSQTGTSWHAEPTTPVKSTTQQYEPSSQPEMPNVDAGGGGGGGGNESPAGGGEGEGG